MIKFTFKLYLIGFIRAIMTNDIKGYIDTAIKKICPICKNKMHKNQLDFYNCRKCFNKYFKENIE